MRADHLKALNAARRSRQAIILATDVDTGASEIWREEDAAWRSHRLADEFSRRFRSGKSGMVTDSSGSNVFLTVQVPPPKLVVVGAVHISQAMVPIARITGFEMIVVDPRTAFAAPERFPDVALYPEWPEDTLPDIGLDPYTAFAAVTHDPKIDDWAIVHALEQDCFYVGALGSRKTHGARLERLTGRGVSPEALERIDAPIGADIGAASPAEIGVAIFANIIAALRKRSDTVLRPGREAAA